MQQDIKPCPFCGQNPELQAATRYLRPTGEPITGYTVVCRTGSCPIRGADYQFYESRERAIWYWNRRLYQDPARQKPAREKTKVVEDWRAIWD